MIHLPPFFLSVFISKKTIEFLFESETSQTNHSQNKRDSTLEEHKRV